MYHWLNGTDFEDDLYFMAFKSFVVLNNRIPFIM